MEQKRICSIEGCDRQHRARGWCLKHYKRWRRLGSPEDKNYVQVFWGRVQKTDSCWTWEYTKDANGYGIFHVTDETSSGSVLAHRYSYELEHGKIPQGLVIDHLCHNPSCVNPGHLRATSQAANAQNRKGMQSNNTVGVRGVERLHNGSYRARVTANGVRYYSALVSTVEEAAQEAQALRDKYHMPAKKIA